MQRRWILLGLLLVVAIGGWAAFRPERLWIDKIVDEDLGAVATPMAAATEPMTAAADTRMPRPLSSGHFHSGAHETAGTAAVFQLADGKRVLRLEGFRTSNGPDVRVYLVAASDVMDDDTVKRSDFVDLGALKGNIGDQNYELPADVDLAKYRSVTIWCRRFGVAFGTSPLSMSQS
jgi:hypothetical protein